MNRRLLWPVAGFLSAVAVTSTMDATGFSAFSALPLFPLLVLFAYLQRLAPCELGFSWGTPNALRHYGLAVLHPIAVMAAIAALAALSGALHPAVVPPAKHPVWMSVALVAGATIPVAILTEEGFFRGWLWASLGRSGLGKLAIVALTSLAFALWHWSSVVLPTGYNPAPAQVPVFMLDAALLGAIWAALRMMSNSVVVASVGHGVWNGLAYVLFGFGTHVGALGISNTALYGPEIGIVGLLLNAAVAAIFLRLAF